MAVIITSRDAKNNPNCGLSAERKDDSTSCLCDFNGERNSRRDIWTEVMEMATIKRKASIPSAIHSQSSDDAVFPINAPVMAIITAAPAASDMIFMDDAIPMRFSGT